MMRCQKCKKDFPENEIHEHHIIPKFMGGTDKDGRIYLCNKCHDILHQIIPSIIWNFVTNDKRIMCKNSIKRFTLRWGGKDDTKTT